MEIIGVSSSSLSNSEASQVSPVVLLLIELLELRQRLRSSLLHARVLQLVYIAR